MRLEMAEFPVAEITLGSEFGYSSETLEINAGELKSLILEDRHIKDASLEVVAPGAKVRITGIRDIVEPRVKVEGKG